jgi:aminobenzoyl-glutamate utilization protein B
MTALGEAKATGLNWIESHRQWFSDFHQEIWHYAEPAFRE